MNMYSTSAEEFKRESRREGLLPTAIASLLDFELLAIQTNVGMFAFLVCHKRILGAEVANGYHGRKAACRLLLGGVRAVPF